MKSNRKSILGRSIALAVFSACFFSAPSHSSVGLASPFEATFASSDSPSRNMIGICEATLAHCMNGGGDSDRCWNAYWRCISR